MIENDTQCDDPHLVETFGSIEETLENRGKRYGAFPEHARITQSIKRAMQDSQNWQALSDDKKEALEMVAHKIGRILNGDPDYVDSWHDIIGYTKLVQDEITVAVPVIGAANCDKLPDRPVVVSVKEIPNEISPPALWVSFDRPYLGFKPSKYYLMTHVNYLSFILAGETSGRHSVYFEDSCLSFSDEVLERIKSFDLVARH